MGSSLLNKNPSFWTVTEAFSEFIKNLNFYKPIFFNYLLQSNVFYERHNGIKLFSMVLQGQTVMF